MALAALPLALPPGTDPDSGIYTEYLGTRASSAGPTSWTVPSGAVWLMVSLTVGLTMANVAGNRAILLEVFDSNNNERVAVMPGTPLTQAFVGDVMFGLGLSDGGRANNNEGVAVQTALPWMHIQPGWLVQCRIEAGVGGDVFNEPSTLCVIEFDYGSAIGGGGTGGGLTEPGTLPPVTLQPGDFLFTRSLIQQS